MEPLFIAAWKATVALTFAWLLDLASRRCSAAARYFLWTVALGAVLAIPVLPLLLPEWHGPVMLSAMAGGAATAANSAGRAVNWIPLIWAAGCAAVLARSLAASLRVGWIRRSARPFAGGAYGPDILVSPKVQIPFTAGWLHSCILLPAEAAEWPEDRLCAVLAHELAHIERRDCLTFLIARTACALYWFHPLVWWAARRMLSERERACDDRVLMGGAAPADFAAHLLEVARGAGRISWAVAAAAHPSQLEGRLLAILDPRVSRRSLTAGAGAAIAGAVLSVALPLALIAAPPGRVYGVGGDVKAPRLLHKVEPQYTQEARDAGIEGTTVLSVVIGADGLADDFRILRSLDAGLDQNAIDAVRQWRFEPGTRKGEPVNVRATIEVNFRLY